MTCKELDIEGVYEITQTPFEDERGWFARIYCEEEFQTFGLQIIWKQINESFTKNKGSFRGIHYQFGPYAEYKLIRCITGSVMDFGVDLRKNSPTLNRHVCVELSQMNRKMLLLPPGVGHAFQTLSDNTTLIYCHSNFYNKAFEGGVRFNDSKIQLYLPLEVSDISERDKNHPLLNEQFSGITYEM